MHVFNLNKQLSELRERAEAWVSRTRHASDPNEDQGTGDYWFTYRQAQLRFVHRTAWTYREALAFYRFWEGAAQIIKSCEDEAESRYFRQAGLTCDEFIAMAAVRYAEMLGDPMPAEMVDLADGALEKLGRAWGELDEETRALVESKHDKAASLLDDIGRDDPIIDQGEGRTLYFRADQKAMDAMKSTRAEDVVMLELTDPWSWHGIAVCALRRLRDNE